MFANPIVFLDSHPTVKNENDPTLPLWEMTRFYNQLTFIL